MKSISTTRRICIASGLALASLFAVPAVAGAATTTCYTGCTPGTVNNNVVAPPSTDPVSTAASVANGSSSLPFTGADIGELAAVGAGAIVVGGVLARRRRSAA
jgi:hypothetical protein